MGASLGGMHALETILRGLGAGFPVPVAVVQHRGPSVATEMVPLLQRVSQLVVSEPDDKEALRPGHVYVAPPDYHLLVEKGRVALSVDARVCHARPSIDVLFESAADSYAAGVLA